MNRAHNQGYVPCSPEQINQEHLTNIRRVLIFGETGAGKSTLANQLSQHVLAAGRLVTLLDTDPGSPAFGIPGALCLMTPEISTDYQHGWILQDFEALCSLDAGRFRLPLIDAVRTLLSRLPQIENDLLIIDAPGVSRCIAGAELLPALIAATCADLVLVLIPEGQPPPLSSELSTSGIRSLFIASHTNAHKPEKAAIRSTRTQKWQQHLTHAVEHTFRLDDTTLLGTPPPLEAPDVWEGRQIALLHKQRTVTLGQVLGLSGNTLRIQAPQYDKNLTIDQWLLRDALYTHAQGLHTAVPERSSSMPANRHPRQVAVIGKEALFAKSQQEQRSPPLMMRVGPVEATMVNGVFGDPLLLIQMGHQKRCILFDLGYHGPICARTAHQVTDVFISHTHIDHICGFLWLLRCRIGHYPPCRLFGPPGLAHNIAGMISGILWDRIGDKAPVFDIYELHDQELRHWQIAAGTPLSEEFPRQELNSDVIWQEPFFRVRAVTLDHTAKDNINPYTPVLAYAFEPLRQVNVRKDQLSALGLTAGPWLQQLKKHVLNGEQEACIRIDGHVYSVSDLTDKVLMKCAGKKLVYATDLADTANNRATLISLAHSAHTLFCEASFVNADSALAKFTGHLTTGACGEIGRLAAVEHLIPFHFSGRYQHEAQRIYQEVSCACPHTQIPTP
ncbi:Clp1/GlmU family protein [Pontibacterium sp.]|uniref:Clp1/GlmU family protein n=1 Tax=Pontibacterium sp. TaxID=2036026 RepID=UPI0035616820